VEAEEEKEASLVGEVVEHWLEAWEGTLELKEG